MSIFYADDDQDDRFFFGEAIEEINHDIDLITADNADLLIEMLKQKPVPPLLIFLDLNMPGKNGIEALKEIKSNNSFKDFPVVIFTTSSDRDAIERTRKLGADGFITKPGKFEALKNLISQCIERNWKTHQVTDQNFVVR